VRSLSFYAYQEDETKFSDLYFISSPQLLIIDANTIHVRAVEASNVLDAPALSSVSKLCVAPTHCYIVKKNFRLFGATHDNNLGALGERVFGPFTRSAMYDQHGATVGHIVMHTGSNRDGTGPCLNYGRDCARVFDS